MSAFVVSDEHIDYLVSAAFEFGSCGEPLTWHVPDDIDSTLPFTERIHTLGDENASLVGQMLLAENVNSVNYRYDEQEWDSLYEFHPVRVEPVQALKAIACYTYQSCEHDGWDTSNAKRFVNALRAAATTALPGYDTASWEITTTTEATHRARRPVPRPDELLTALRRDLATLETPATGSPGDISRTSTTTSSERVVVLERAAGSARALVSSANRGGLPTSWATPHGPALP